MVKNAPPESLFSAEICPWWASTMVRAIASPIPMPCGLVVKNGSKTFLRSPAAIPGPVSSILISALVPKVSGYADFAQLCLRFGYRVHRVDNQIQNDLLQLNSLALHVPVSRGRAALKCDIAPVGHSCDKSDHLPYRLVQVDISHFKRCLLQHAAKPAYHFAGALIVTPDV